jgi:DNA-binding transcriptional regulator WhiA
MSHLKKELYQLRAKVSASCVFAVSRVVNNTRFELQRKIWVYKMSRNLTVLTQFYCTLQFYAHMQNC